MCFAPERGSFAYNTMQITCRFACYCRTAVGLGTKHTHMHAHTHTHIHKCNLLQLNEPKNYVLIMHCIHVTMMYKCKSSRLHITQQEAQTQLFECAIIFTKIEQTFFFIIMLLHFSDGPCTFTAVHRDACY